MTLKTKSDIIYPIFAADDLEAEMIADEMEDALLGKPLIPPLPPPDAPKSVIVDAKEYTRMESVFVKRYMELEISGFPDLFSRDHGCGKGDVDSKLKIISNDRGTRFYGDLLTAFAEKVEAERKRKNQKKLEKLQLLAAKEKSPLVECVDGLISSGRVSSIPPRGEVTSSSSSSSGVKVQPIIVLDEKHPSVKVDDVTDDKDKK